MSRISIYKDDALVSDSVLMRASMSLGRHSDNDIVLDDRTLSRFHARVERRGDRFFVIDLNAQNGVFLNGARISGATPLSPGDRIVLGKFVAIFDGQEGTARRRRTGVTKDEAALDIDIAEPSQEGTLTNAEADDFSVDVSDEKLALGLDDPKTALIKKRPAKEPIVVLLYNSLEVSKHTVGTGLVIGRSKHCDVVISLLGLSRKHAHIEKRKDGVFVVDHESQNGTWVNNTRVDAERKLAHGDLLNFYEYGVLYLEDPDVAIDLAGVGFSPSTEHGDLLSMQETGRRDPIAVRGVTVRAGTERAAVPLVDSALPSVAEDMMNALGDGAHFGDNDDDPFADDDDEEEVEAAPEPVASSRMSSSTMMTSGLDDSFSSSDIDEDVIAEIEGLGEDATSSHVGKFKADKTSFSHAMNRRRDAWATDEELERALVRREDRRTRRIEVFLDDQLYTQVPVTQQVTRVGTDTRCEIALPKEAGLTGWQITLIRFPSAMMLYRASESARVLIDDAEIDQAVLSDGDSVQLGRIRITLRIR